MSTSPILGWALLSQSQNNKYATVNAMGLALEAAANSVYQVQMADANQTPAASVIEGNCVFQCQGTLTADRSLILPNSFRVCIVHNLTSGGHNIVVTTASGHQQVKIPVAEDIVTGSLGVIFGTTGARMVYCDGQNNFWAVN
jgi:hypothetical protein